MHRNAKQQKLIDAPVRLVNGLVYRPDFITEAEEEVLLAYIENLAFKNARFEEYQAKRKIFGFGWSYDFDNRKLIPGPPLPTFLGQLQRRIAKWLDIERGRVAHALVTEYPPGTPIGWHRDSEEFEHIIGISLKGWCTMQFRPVGNRDSGCAISVELEPRSAYIMQKAVRWKYQHHIPPTKTHRYSITFRTLPN